MSERPHIQPGIDVGGEQYIDPDPIIGFSNQDRVNQFIKDSRDQFIISTSASSSSQVAQCRAEMISIPRRTVDGDSDSSSD